MQELLSCIHRDGSNCKLVEEQVGSPIDFCVDDACLDCQRQSSPMTLNMVVIGMSLAYHGRKGELLKAKHIEAKHSDIIRKSVPLLVRCRHRSPHPIYVVPGDMLDCKCPDARIYHCRIHGECLRSHIRQESLVLLGEMRKSWTGSICARCPDRQV